MISAICAHQRRMTGWAGSAASAGAQYSAQDGAPVITTIFHGAAVARGVIVTNTPGVLTEDTADMVMALIVAAAKYLDIG